MRAYAASPGLRQCFWRGPCTWANYFPARSHPPAHSFVGMPLAWCFLGSCLGCGGLPSIVGGVFVSGKRMGYDAVRIEALEGREAVRKRPGMWVGSTGEHGLHELVLQAVSWSVNRVLAYREGGSVDVTLTDDGGVRVADDGPEVPFTADGKIGGSGLEEALTAMPAAERGGRRIVHLSPVGCGGSSCPTSCRAG